MTVFKAYFVSQDYSSDLELKGYRVFSSKDNLATIKKRFLLFIYNSTKDTIEHNNKIYEAENSLSEEVKKCKEDYLASKRDLYQVKKKVSAFITLNDKNKNNPYKQQQKQLENEVGLKYKKLANSKKKRADYDEQYEKIEGYKFKLGNKAYFDYWSRMENPVKELLATKNFNNMNRELSFLFITWLEVQTDITSVEFTGINDINSEYYNDTVESFNEEPDEGTLSEERID